LATYLLQYATSLATFASVTIAEPSLAVAQAMAQSAATITRSAITLSSTTYAGQSWTYQPGAAPVGYWIGTYNEVWSTLGSSSTLDAQESAVGQSLAAALQTAGNAYDLASTQGVKNASVYALQRGAWADVLAEPAWLELDRLCRFAYTTIASNAALTQAAFAGVALSWQPSTSYGSSGPSFIVPSPANGFVYSTTDYVANVNDALTSGTRQPTWPTTIGAKVADQYGEIVVGGSPKWTCIAAVPSSAGAALPFDQTLAAEQTLLARYRASTAIASGNAPILAMLSAAYSAWQTAAAAMPAADAGQDAASATATANLNAALANAQTWISAASFQ